MADRRGAGARAAPAERRADRRIVALLVGIPALALTVPALAGYPLITGDNLVQNLPLRALAGTILRHGHLPTYDAYLWSGTPLLGGINGGIALPDELLFVALPALSAFVCCEILAFAAAATGCFAFLRARRRSPLASGIGAATYAFCGFVTSQASHLGVVEIAAALAWGCYALEGLARGAPHRLARTGLLGAAIGCLGCSASPETAAYALIGLAILACAHLLRPPAGGPRRWLSLGAATAVGAAIAAVQIIPGQAVVAMSQRASVGYGFLTAGGLGADQVFALVAPHVLGGGPLGLRPYVGHYNLAEIDAYVGVLGLVALVSALTRVARRDAAPWRVFLVLVVVGLVFAAGGATPLPHLVAHLPVLGASRLPSRALLVYSLGASGLLASWCDDVCAPGLRATFAVHRPRLGLVAPGAILGFVLACAIGGTTVARAFAGRATGPWSRAAVAPYLVAAGVLAVVAGAFCARAGALSPAARRRALVAIVVIDLVVFCANQSSLAPAYASDLGPNALSARVAELTGARGRVLVADAALAHGRDLNRLGAADLNVLRGQESAQGYASLVWHRYAAATGTHGQNLVRAGALSDGTLVELGVRLVLAATDELVSPGPARAPTVLGPGGTTRYLGRTAPLSAITVRAASPTAARRVAARIRLLDRRGGRADPGGSLEPDGPDAVTLRLPRPERPAGIVFGSGRGRAFVTLTLADGRRIAPTGPIAASLGASSFRPTGTVGAFSAFVSAAAAPPLRVEGARAARAPGVRIDVRSASGDTGSEEIAVAARRPFVLVRSVAAIPGWSASIDRLGSVTAVPIGRDGLVQRIQLPAGSYVLRLTYTAPGLVPALVLGVLGWFAVAALCGTDLVLARRARWRRGTEDDGSGNDACGHERSGEAHVMTSSGSVPT